MKKLKVFLALIFSLACMFSLIACGGNDGFYVDDSFDVDISYYSYDSVSASVEFQVCVPNKGKHEISYTLVLYYNDNRIKSETFTNTCNSNGNEMVNISKYWTVDYTASSAASYNFNVGLTNVKVKKATSLDDSYVEFAIGFGVTGGVILVGIIVLYICLNKKGGKQQAE